MRALFAPLLLAGAALLGGSAESQVVRPSQAYGSVRYVLPSGSPAPTRVWVPARVITLTERVWIPTTWERIWVEPRWSVRLDACGIPFRVLVRTGHYERVVRPGHYETRPVQRSLPGHWVVRGHR